MANSYLNRTNTSPSGSGYKYTFSAWIKRSKISERQMFWRVLNPSATTYYAYMEFQADDRLHINDYSSNGTLDIVTTAYLRDTNAWYHIMGVVDTTQGAAADRVKLYVNGSQVTALAASTLTVGQNQAITGTESGKTTYVGGDPANNTRFFDGYMSHVAFVDGSVVAPTAFGETDSTSGIWKFKSPSGVTWGNNGFHLKMENSGNLGLDSSGQTNNFTVNGNLKQSIDTPSIVYATFNPLDKSGGTVTTFSNGNTTTMHNAGNNGATTAARSTLGYSSGKWYWEAKCIATGGDVRTGIISMSSTNYATAANPYTLNEAYNYKQNGQKGSSGDTNVSYAATYTAGDIIGIAHDADSGSLTFYKNGASQGVAFSGLSTSLTWGAFSTEYNQGKYSYNFGNGFFGTTAITSAGSNGNGSLFEYDVPSGYYALNTKNINTYG